MKDYSEAEKQYIIDNFYKYTEWEMVNYFNLTFGTDRSFDSLHAFKKRLRKKGLLGSKVAPIVPVTSGYRGKSITIHRSKKETLIKRILRRIWEWLG